MQYAHVLNRLWTGCSAFTFRSPLASQLPDSLSLPAIIQMELYIGLLCRIRFVVFRIFVIVPIAIVTRGSLDKLF
jgi:hypothetical protein